MPSSVARFSEPGLLSTLMNPSTTHFRDHGILRLTPSGETLSPATTLDQFERTDLRSRGELGVGHASNLCRFLALATVEGASVHLLADFEHGHLRVLELTLTDPPEPPYDHAAQLRLKARHDAWLARLIAPAPLTPLVVEHDGLRVSRSDPDWPLGFQTAWGSARSIMDAKAGFASIVIRYAKFP